jgi:hypothetical protein
MMTGNLMVGAGRAGGFLLAAGGGAAGPGPPGSRGIAVGGLVSWLIAELLGLYMLRSWIASGGLRDRQARPEGISAALIFGHAGLAFAGLVSWASFWLTGSAAAAWVAVGFLAPAIGLGISTVTIWTPYPAQRPAAIPATWPDPDGRAGSAPAILVTNEMLDRALANEAVTSELVDDLLERMLATPESLRPASRRWRLAPVIPVLHGMAAIVTFLLVILAAITVTTT